MIMKSYCFGFAIWKKVFVSRFDFKLFVKHFLWFTAQREMFILELNHLNHFPHFLHAIVNFQTGNRTQLGVKLQESSFEYWF